MSRLPRRTGMSRRTPLARGGGLRRTGRIYSDRRLAELADESAARRAAVAAASERDGHRCTAAPLVPLVACWGPLDGHEPLTRGRGGDPLNADHIDMVCRGHHEWIGANITAATELGLLRHAWEGPKPR